MTQRKQQTRSNLFARRTLPTFGSSSSLIRKFTCLHDRPFARRLALFSHVSFKINHRDSLAQGAPRPGFPLGGPRPGRNERGGFSTTRANKCHQTPMLGVHLTVQPIISVSFARSLFFMCTISLGTTPSNCAPNAVFTFNSSHYLRDVAQEIQLC